MPFSIGAHRSVFPSARILIMVGTAFLRPIPRLDVFNDWFFEWESDRYLNSVAARGKRCGAE